MLTLRKMTINRWSMQRQKLYAEAKEWGLDEETACSITDRELVNWTAEELSTVLRKVKGVKPGHARTMPSDSEQGSTTQPLQTWVKAPDELVRQSAAEHKALCINIKGEFSLRENDYFAISHVWIEGIQGNQMNKGASRTVIDHIFKSVSVIPKVEWLWLDVLAIPSGHDTLTAAQEIEKIDIINTLGAIYEKAKAVIIFDALVKHLESTDLVDVAVTLVCGKWMSRVWTYQEIKLARRAIILTGTGPVEYSAMIQELRKKHNNMDWNADFSNLTDEQRPARFKFRMLYMTLDLLQYDPRVHVSIPDIVFACNRRTTGNDIDYVRAFFPVLELKWKAGMTKEDGLRAVYDQRPYGYDNAARVILTFGNPRVMVWPGWAPDSLCGLSGMIFPRNAGFKHTVRGLVYTWTTFKIKSLTKVHFIKDLWSAEIQNENGETSSFKCILFLSSKESQETITAVQETVTAGKAFLLLTPDATTTMADLTGIVISKSSDQYTGFAYMVIYIWGLEATSNFQQVTWTLHNENPMNKILDGGQQRLDSLMLFEQDNRDYEALRMADLLSVLPKDPNVDQKDENGRILLHKAAAKGDLEAVKTLLTQGASVDLVDNQNATALNIAADQRQASVLQALIDAGANIRHKGRIGPALTEAVGSHSVECARILLENGANPDGEEEDDFLWPLIVASDDGKMTELLLKHGANPNKCSAIKLTALHFASRHRNAETVSRLVDGGAKVNVQLSDGSLIDPLYYAIQEQGEDAVNELLSHGADANASYVNGKSPLMLAAGIGNAKIVKALLDNHADLHRKENGTKTALDFANQAGKKVVVKLLTERLNGK